MFKILITQFLLSALIILVDSQMRFDDIFRIIPPFGKKDGFPFRIKRILQKVFSTTEDGFHYDTLPTIRYDVAFDAVMKNLVPIRNEMATIDTVAATYMCGFGHILKDHEGILNSIDFYLDNIHSDFLRFTGMRRKYLALMPDENNSKLPAESICEFLDGFDVEKTFGYWSIMTDKGLRIDGEDWWNKIFADFQNYPENDYAQNNCGPGHPPTAFFYGLLLRIIIGSWRVFIVRYVHDYIAEKYAPIDPICKKINDHREMNNFDEWNRIYTSFAEYSPNWFQGFWQGIPNDIFNCDTTKLIRDKTFIELEGAFQVVPLPSTYKSDKKCGANTDLHLNRYGFYDGYCEDDWSCSMINRPCLGHIYNCVHAFEWTTDRIEYCALESGPRRYLFFSYRGNIVENATEFCKDGVLGDVSGGNSGSGVCLCTCNDNHVDSASTHVVNLMPVESNYQDNKVITGVQFIVVNRVLHLQIQEAPLEENLLIYDSEWKPVDDISGRVRESRLYPNKPGLTASKDYVILNNKHKFDLGMLSVGKDEVLTGVQFTEVDGGHLSISITARTFDAPSGKICLDCPPKYYKKPVGNTHPFEVDAFLPLSKPSVFKTIRDDIYIPFRPSIILTDSGQTTIPYFDAQPVFAQPPIPLSGIESTLKISPEGHVMISLRLRAINYKFYTH